VWVALPCLRIELKESGEAMDLSETVCMGSLVLFGIVLPLFALVIYLFKPFQCPQCKKPRAGQRIAEQDRTFSYQTKIPDKWDTWNNKVKKWKEVPVSKTVTTYTYRCRYCGYKWDSDTAPISRQFTEILLKCLMIVCLYLSPCLGLFIGKALGGLAGAIWGVLIAVTAAVGVAAWLTNKFRLY
jgi:hypothetical protein